MLKYSAKGTGKHAPWRSAAWDGNSTPPYARRGVRRAYNVDATLPDGTVVSESWLSEMDAEVRKAVLKELGLPVRKALVYRRADGALEHVADLMIEEVWDGWCGLAVETEESGLLPLPVHSQHFAEMNAEPARSA